MTLESVYPQPTYTEHVSLKEAIDDIESDEDEIKELYDAVEKGFLSKWIPPASLASLFVTFIFFILIFADN